jgi:hypothetical protein
MPCFFIPDFQLPIAADFLSSYTNVETSDTPSPGTKNPYWLYRM